MAFLLTHSLFHLLGYDHVNSEEEEKEMFGKQDKVLDKLGITREFMIKFLKGFGYAAAGICHGFNERNFRVHICAVLFVTWFALKFYELSRAEWAVSASDLRGGDISGAFQHRCGASLRQSLPVKRTSLSNSARTAPPEPC